MLPPETLIKIFEEFVTFKRSAAELGRTLRETPVDLARICLTSRLFNKLATPLLYHDIRIPDSYGFCTSLVRLLKDNSSLLQHVVFLGIRLPTEKKDENDPSEEISEKDAMLLLEKCTNLRHLMLYARSGSRSEQNPRSELHQQVLDVLTGSQSIQSLYLLGDVAVTIPHLPALTELATNCSLPPMLSSSALPSLKALNIRMSRKALDIHHYHHLETVLPRLCRLDLGVVTKPLFATKVLQHGAHLKHLSFAVLLYGNFMDEPKLRSISGELPSICEELEQLDFQMYSFGPLSDSESPSQQVVTGIKKLLLDLRKSKILNVEFQWPRQTSEAVRDNYEGYLRGELGHDGVAVNVAVTGPKPGSRVDAEV